MEDTLSNRSIYPLNAGRQCATETCSFAFFGIEPPNAKLNFLVDHLLYPQPHVTKDAMQLESD
jgi:hypothetical protein